MITRSTSLALPALLVLFAGVAPESASAAAGAPSVAVLPIDDQLPMGGRLPLDKLTGLRSALESELAKGGHFKVQPYAGVEKALAKRKLAACNELGCTVEIGKELAVAKMVTVNLRLESSMCVVSATLVDVDSKRSEITASHPATCDQSALLEVTRARIGAALRGEGPKVEGGKAAAPEKVTDRKLVGKWVIKRNDTNQETDTGDLTGAQVDLEADGRYRISGKIAFDRGDAPQEIALSGTYGFDGKVLAFKGWGPEFARCEMLPKAPIMKASAFTWAAFESAPCKMFIDGAGSLWLWYRGDAGVITLDLWKRERR